MATIKKTKKNIKKGGKLPKKELKNLEKASKEKITAQIKKKSSPAVFKEALFQGVIDMTPKGFGFAEVEGRDEDIFIPASAMNGAMHGDTVLIKLTSHNRGGGEGEVFKIVKRGFERIVCTFKKSGNYSYASPENIKFGLDIFISKSNTLNAENNDVVVVEILSYGLNKCEGKIIEVLGQPDEKNVDMMAIIRAHNLYETFPKSVIAEADKIPDFVSDEEKKGREDYTNDLVITIDGEDSRDFDDAVNLIKTEKGLYRLSVHIADVTHYVNFNSKLDKEAYKRGTSVYFPELVLPMLPKKLSNGICSLNENVERLSLSCVMDIDGEGNVLKYKIKEGVIKSRNRMTYEKVAAILDGDKALKKEYSHLVPMLETMSGLSKILYSRRENRGAIEFDITESQIILDENAKVKEITKKPRLISHRIIEEFMLIANETVAEHMFKLNAPFVYRSHEKPPSLKMEGLVDFLKGIGAEFDFSENPQSKEFSLLLKSVPENLSAVVNRVTLRSMSKATYEPVNNGHFGLAAPYYCHFTSPIRRYPDLVIHRIIKDFLKNGKSCFNKYTEFVADASKQSSERERGAEKAEREVDDLKKAEFMSHKIGMEFDGIVSGVIEWGFFVELENSCEGLVRTESLPGFSYNFNPRTMTLSNGAVSYRIGDKVKVLVESVEHNKVNFVLAKASE